jgi:hypothetical protein
MKGFIMNTEAQRDSYRVDLKCSRFHLRLQRFHEQSGMFPTGGGNRVTVRFVAGGG